MDEERSRVVDDEASVCKALERLLRAAGFDAATFASGREFFSSMESRRPDCIVLDLHMPGMNGLGVQRCIEQAGAQVPAGNQGTMPSSGCNRLSL